MEGWDQNIKSSGSHSDSMSFEIIDSILQTSIRDAIIPGAVVLVNRDGKTIYESAFGYAQLYAFGKKPLTAPELMTSQHRFDLASLTKVFATTFGIMLLYEKHKIDLDLPAYRYLPEFRSMSKDSITIRHLLTHSAGLHPWKPIYYHAKTPAESRRYITHLPLKYPVGAGRHYSDLGFMLLGYIVEELSGVSLDSFLSENLYQPLGLKYTSFNPDPNGPPFAATSHGNPFEKKMVFEDDFGYDCDEDPNAFTGWRNYVLKGEVNDGNAYYAHQGEAGHAGLFSTAQELKILLDLLLNHGQYQGKRILSDKTVKAFIKKDRFGHGLGWAMSPDAVPVKNLPPGSFGHTGFTGTFVVGVPKYNLSVIILTNRQNLDVNPDGTYNSLTTLRMAVTETIIDLVATQ